MPGVEELDQLQGLLSRLDALATAAPGQVIRAADWNGLVSVVVEIARAALATDDADAVAVHEHVEQVSIGWLAPSLRAVIERGPLGDPAASARVDALARLAGQLARRADDAETQVERVRASLGDSATREVERQSRLLRVQRSVDEIDHAGQDVLELRSSLNDLGAKVGEVLEVGSRLTVDGQPIDLGAITKRVDRLDAFREKLRQPTGELLDAAAVARDLADLRASIPPARDGGGGVRLTGQELDELVERAKGAIVEQVDASIERGRKATRVELIERLGAIDAIAARAVADALPAEAERVRSALSQEVAAATNAVRDESIQRLDARVAEAVGTVQAGFEERLGRERAQIRDEQETRLAATREELDSRAVVRERDTQVRLATDGDARFEDSRLQLTEFIATQRQELTVQREELTIARRELSVAREDLAAQRQELTVVKEQVGGATLQISALDARNAAVEAQVTRANPVFGPQRSFRPNP